MGLSVMRLFKGFGALRAARQDLDGYDEHQRLRNESCDTVEGARLTQVVRDAYVNAGPLARFLLG